MWSYMKKFYRMVHRDHPSILFWVIAGGITKAFVPFVVLVGSAKVLDSLIAYNMDIAKYQIIIMLLVAFSAGCMEKVCYHAVQIIANTAHFSVLKQTALKAYVVEYEQFEKTETKDKIRRTRTGSNGSGGVDAQIDLTYNLVYTITSVLFSLIYTLQLFVKSFYNPVFRIYTIGLVAIFALLMRIISVFQKKSSEEEVKTQREN